MRPETQQALEDLFYTRKNLPDAAKSCNLTNKEMKIIFSEFCKLHPPNFQLNND